jgi:hypothetical protein
MKRLFGFVLGVIIFSIPLILHAQVEYRYAVIVSSTTLADPDWAEVVDSLVARHSAQVFSYTSNVWETQTQVSEFQPDYIGFVCQVGEANYSFVTSSSTYNKDHAWWYQFL